MPINVSCPCGTTLKAPDHLAGKAVKCPKCAAVVKVPGAATSSVKTAPAARAPAAKAPAAPARAPKPEADPNTKPFTKGLSSRREMVEAQTKSIDGDDEDEAPNDPNVKAAPSRKSSLPSAEIPPELKDRVMKEVPRNEKLVWVGQPNPTLVFRRNLWALITAVIMLVAGGIWTVSALKDKNLSIVMLIGPLMIVVFAVGLIIYPFVKKAIARKTFYLVTNKRAIIWVLRPVIGVYRDVYQPAQLVNLHRENAILVRGAGDVIFRTKVIIQTTKYVDRRTGMSRGSSTSRRTIHYGFLAVDRPQEVEKLVRETLLEKFLDKLEKIQEQLNQEDDDE